MLILLDKSPHWRVSNTRWWPMGARGYEYLEAMPVPGERYGVSELVIAASWLLYQPPSSVENGWGEPAEEFDQIRLVACVPDALVSPPAGSPPNPVTEPARLVRVTEVLMLADIARHLPAHQPRDAEAALDLLERRHRSLDHEGGSWGTEDEVAEPHWFQRRRRGKLHCWYTAKQDAYGSNGITLEEEGAHRLVLFESFWGGDDTLLAVNRPLHPIEVAAMESGLRYSSDE